MTTSFFKACGKTPESFDFTNTVIDWRHKFRVYLDVKSECMPTEIFYFGNKLNWLSPGNSKVLIRFSFYKRFGYFVLER